MSQETQLNQLTLFVEDSPAKTLALRVSGLDWMENAQPYGVSSPELFASLSQDGSWLKMYGDCFQLTMDNSLETYSGTYPEVGMMRNGRLYEHRILEPLIRENASGLLPTPTAQLGLMAFCKRDAIRVKNKEKRASGAQIGVSLRWSPDLLPYYNDSRKPLWVNPLLCEWMMGYPQSWTDCTNLEMP